MLCVSSSKFLDFAGMISCHLEIVDRFIDHGISGAKGRDARPELDRMMKDSTKRKFDVVLVWSIERLGRSLQKPMKILNNLNANNIDL